MIYLIISETVKIKWNGFTKSHYINKGYLYTKQGDEFEVLVSDLMPSSTALIEVQCDYCGCKKHIRYSAYLKSISDATCKYSCSKCVHLKQAELYKDKRIENRRIKYDELINCMIEKGYTPTCSFDDYHDENSKMSYICPIHGNQTTTYTGLVRNHSGCNECGNVRVANKLKHTPSEVKDIVESKNNDILLNPEEYVNAYTKNLRIICGTCGEEFITSLSSINNSNGMCLKCGCKVGG